MAFKRTTFSHRPLVPTALLIASLMATGTPQAVLADELANLSGDGVVTTQEEQPAEEQNQPEQQPAQEEQQQPAQEPPAQEEQQQPAQEEPAPAQEEPAAQAQEDLQVQANAWEVSADKKTLTIKSTGDWPEAWSSESQVPWYADRATIEKVVIEKNAKPTTCAFMFSGCKNLTTIEGLDGLDTSIAASMQEMFKGCEVLESLDISSFNTIRGEGTEESQINTKDMFNGCSKLSEIKVGTKFKVKTPVTNQEATQQDPKFPTPAGDGYTGSWSNGSEKKSASDLYTLYQSAQPEYTWKWQKEVAPQVVASIVGDFEYNGKKQEPAPTVKVSYDTKDLKEKTDYTVTTTFKDNIDAGTAKAEVKVTPTSLWTGGGYVVLKETTVSPEFQIKPKPVHLAIKVYTDPETKKNELKGSLTYDGYKNSTDQQNLSITIKATASDFVNSDDATKLKATKTCDWKKGANAKSYPATITKVTYKVSDTETVTLYSSDGMTPQADVKCNYTVTSETITNATIKVEKANIKSATVAKISDRTYTGSEIKPTPTVKMANTTLKNLTKEPDELTKQTYYTLAYKNNKNVGTATITITGKGNYTGTTTTTFKIKAKSSSSNSSSSSSSYSKSSTAKTGDATMGVTAIVIAGAGAAAAGFVLRKRSKGNEE